LKQNFTFSGNDRGTDHLGYLGIYERIILRWVKGRKKKTDIASVTKHHTLQEHSLLTLTLQGSEVGFFTYWQLYINRAWKIIRISQFKPKRV
jgi:hypothetical protein